MIIKLTRGEDFVFIDNEGEVFQKVEVSGNNVALVRSLNDILNVHTAIRFKGELKGIDPELIVRDGDKPAEINKASNLYLTKYLISDLKAQGFNVTTIKE